MKWLVLLAVLVAGAGGLFWFVVSDHERQDVVGPAGDEWADPSCLVTEDGCDAMLLSEGTLPVGVYGAAGGAPKAADGAWRSKALQWPDDATRVTGKVLLAAIAGQVSVRFADARSQREFEDTEFLNRVPRDETLELTRVGDIVESFGFVVVDRETWILIGKPGS